MKRLTFALLGLAALLAGCAQKDNVHTIRVSVADQKMTVFRHGAPIALYDCSTSKFGLGDQRGSYRTPLGRMEVAKKIGDGAPMYMKFKSRRATGEIVQPDSPGRDPIVTRILWLRGLEAQNARAFDRGIYIHGTAEERNIGRPASYGCIRMRSRDVLSLYNIVGVGAKVDVVPGYSSATATAQAAPPPPVPTATAATPAQTPVRVSASAAKPAKNGHKGSAAL